MPSQLVMSVCPNVRSCEWSEHGRKHFPHRAMKKAHTTHGPARYLPGTSQAAIRQLESTTVAHGTQAGAGEFKFEYARHLDHVIGWDQGEDASVSFAECSGGEQSGRVYHGRPMCPSNPKLEAP